MSEVYLSDNNGNRVPPGTMAADPIAGSGILLTDATIGEDHELTVVPDAMYVVTGLVGVMFFGIADVTNDANVLWIGTPYESCIIKVPADVSTLHYEGSSNGASVRMRRLN